YFSGKSLNTSSVCSIMRHSNCICLRQWYWLVYMLDEDAAEDAIQASGSHVCSVGIVGAKSGMEPKPLQVRTVPVGSTIRAPGTASENSSLSVRNAVRVPFGIGGRLRWNTQVSDASRRGRVSASMGTIGGDSSSVAGK